MLTTFKLIVKLFKVLVKPLLIFMKQLRNS